MATVSVFWKKLKLKTDKLHQEGRQRPFFVERTRYPMELWKINGRAVPMRAQEMPRLAVYVEHYGAKGRLFGEQTRMLEELTTLGEERNVDVCVWSPGSLTKQRAYRFDGRRQQWMVEAVDLPHVVLRRSGVFARGKFHLARTELDSFRKMKLLHTLPTEHSDKWALARMAANSSRLASFCPETACVQSPETAYALLAEWPQSYLKSRRGSQGKGVFRVSSQKNELFIEWHERFSPSVFERGKSVYAAETKTCFRRIKTLEEFRVFWRQAGLRQAVVQRAVSLLRWNDRPIDFRWLVQKGRRTGVVARVARYGKPDGVTTNLHAGATAYPAESLLHRSMSETDAVHLVNTMDSLGLEVFSAFWEKFGPYVEIGVDFAVTSTGDVFILEVNPTPGRRMLRALPGDVRRRSLLTWMDYVEDVQAAPTVGYRGR